MPTRSLRLLPLLLLALAGCMAHDKSGDRAAAVGDWRSAYLEYRQALSDDPANPELKKKFEQARTEALKTSTANARNCASRRDWACATSEADFVLSIEPSNAEMAALRGSAGRELGLAYAEQARVQATQGKVREADATIKAAQKASNDPAVQQALGRAAGVLVKAAVVDADRYCQARQFNEAIAMLELALVYEPSLRGRIDEVRREEAAWRRSEHDRLMAEGDGFLAANAWTDAGARYKAAQVAVPDERARALEQYARLALGADAAVERGDWPAATRGYQEMVTLRVERNGYAAAQLERVMVRGYTIQVRSVLVSPIRPDGLPWVGPPRPAVMRAANELARAQGVKVSSTFLMLLGQVPRENQPTVVIEVTTPEGRRLLTTPHRGLHSTYSSAFVVSANSFDRRRLAFRVFHTEPGGLTETMGLLEIPLGDLLTRGGAMLTAPSVNSLELSVEPAPNVPPGSFVDLTPVAEQTAPPAGPPPPRPPRP